ncbi:hypothetical protein EUX98_g8176 [Antrodiella citrinella]|uniref:U3 small nucleolar RNA-associated protein 22 n=1 Tax=Antrodiella citrinella TaxID=2447956 RepID=A0A4S4MCB5_9APHY|nr:hypothetical protein EUX98_g8176 [Antrodiella citrinella]
MALDKKRKRVQEKQVTVFEEEKDDELMAHEDIDNVASGSDVSGDKNEENNEMHVDGNEAAPAASAQASGSRRPPTALELRDIKDAADLYKSSSFKLQIDALLPNVRPKYQNFPPLDRFLTLLYTCLNSLPSIPSRHPLEAAKDLLKKEIAVPYTLPLPAQDVNWKVAFEKPTEVILVGSWPNKLSVRAKDKRPYVVDLAVEIPSTLLQEKDYLNGRFFQKRAYFLSVLAAGIQAQKSGLHAEVFFSSPSGDPRLTCLIIRPKEGSSNDLTKLNTEIRIIPMLGSSSPIPLPRLSPAKANIRTSPSDGASEDAQSPVYNTSILLSTTPKTQLLQSHHLKGLVPAYSDALTLLRIWANQRGYSRGRKLCIAGFESSNFFWSAVLDLVISGEDPGTTSANKSAKRKPLGKGLSSYQLFRAALDFLAKQDFVPRSGTDYQGRQFSPDDYSSDAAVFVDSTGINVLTAISSGSLDMLRHDAKATLGSLNGEFSTQDPFKETFLTDYRGLQSRFDVVMRVDISAAKLRAHSVHSTIEHGSLYKSLLSTIVASIRQALELDVTHSPIIFIGLVLDVEHAFRLVDHGPPADDPDLEAAQRFRDFWGDKAELRRFKDGAISESVVWDVKTSDERTKIPYSICTHILALHCGISQALVQHWQDSFDNILRLPATIISLYQGKADSGFRAAQAAFDSLLKSIKSLDEELPLAVLNVSPTSDMLRNTSVFTPTAVSPPVSASLPPSAQYLQPIEVVIEFEGSGRWPDELRAIQKVKLAMFERLASSLMGSTPGLKATVVVGDPVSTSDILDVASLEIITPQGWAFVARIWHNREAMLLDNAIDDKPHIPTHIKRKLPGSPDLKSRQAALEAKEVHVRRFLHAPRHHRAVAALNHRYTAYAGTVRLVKRWLAAHWVLQKYLSIEAVELLCAAVFVGNSHKSASPSQQQQTNVPGTKERGFAKVVELLKEWKWEQGIFVPYGDDTEDAPKSVFNASGRDGVWKISTEFDPEGYMWTRDAPDAIMARRIQTIAGATWSCLQTLEDGNLDVMTIFAHPVQQYDFIVELNPALLPRYHQNIIADPTVWARKAKYANVEVAEGSHSATQPGYDPAQLLFNDLSRVYKDTFMLFHDPLGGERIGGVWDPRLQDPRAFKILGKFSSIPVAQESGKDKATVALNKDAILWEIERFGAGLITNITQRD